MARIFVSFPTNKKKRSGHFAFRKAKQFAAPWKSTCRSFHKTSRSLTRSSAQGVPVSSNPILTVISAIASTLVDSVYPPLALAYPAQGLFGTFSLSLRFFYFKQVLMRGVLRPFGVKCNIRCESCYQNPQREAGNVLRSYHMEKMKAASRKRGRIHAVGRRGAAGSRKKFGGTLVVGFQNYRSNGIQTNGVLINENHVRMFEQYKVQLGAPAWSRPQRNNQPQELEGIS